MVGQEQPVDQIKARTLQAAASTTPQLKSLAAQSMALLSIRSNKYSDAWKYATSDSASLAAASRSVQLTNEKIRLWLLVEARSNKAEDQLKRLVTMTIHADTTDADRQDTSYFLGKILKLLDESGPTRGISQTTIDQARQALETQSSKTAVSRYQSGWQELEQWDSDLRGLASKCQDALQAQATLDDVSNQLESHQRKVVEATQQYKQEKATETKLDHYRTGVIRELRQVEAESNRETPGKPKAPANPRPLPNNPGKDASYSEQSRYQAALREYNRSIDNNVRLYEVSLREWHETDRQRRAQLRDQKVAIEKTLTLAVSSCKAQQALVKDLGVELADLNRQVRALRHQTELAQLLLSRAQHGDRALETLQLPSIYPVLDFARESSRLSKMVNVR